MSSSTDYLKMKYSLNDLDADYYKSIGLEYPLERGRGMSSFQRFIIAVLLFLAVLIIGTMVLVVTEKVFLF